MAVETLPIHKRVQFPRNTTAVVNTYIGLAGEITFDLNRKEIRAHFGDGKPGGHRILNINQLLTLFLSVDSEAAKIKFTGSTFGFLTRTGNGVWRVREFKTEDGLGLTNPKGIDGNPVLTLPERLKVTAGDGVSGDTLPDMNLLLDSGFYSVPATTLNLPTEIQNIDAANVFVIKRSDSYITQLVVNVRADMGAWMRSMVAGAWQTWVNIIPAEGTEEILSTGTDTEQRTWSAFDLESWLTNRLQDVGSEDSGGGAVDSYGGAKRKVNDKLSGPGINDQIYGPFTIANKDRWILFTSTRARKIEGGVNFEDTYRGGTTTVQLEMDGSWKTVLNRIPGTLSASNLLIGGRVRFIWDATNTQIIIASDDWGTLDTVNGTWSGRMRLSTDQDSMNVTFQASRFKLKT